MAELDAPHCGRRSLLYEQSNNLLDKAQDTRVYWGKTRTILKLKE